MKIESVQFVVHCSGNLYINLTLRIQKQLYLETRLEKRIIIELNL